MYTKELVQKHFLAIGKNIAQARYNRSEKIETVAKSVGLSASVISQIENGRYLPLKMKTLMSLCEYLEVPMEEIFQECPIER
jgi:DNA-binding XRE family transcriptional regulator